VLALGVTAAAAGFAVLKLTANLPRTSGGITIALPPAEGPVAEQAFPGEPAAAPEDAQPEAAAANQPPKAAPEAAPEVEAQQAAAEAQATEAQQPEAPEQTAPAPTAIVQGPPRIAVVITGLGLSKAATEQAVDRLPPEISLSFSPYAGQLNGWIARARARGHEVLIDLPMEPATFPNDDPGPRALLIGLTPAQNLERLRWILGRGQGYIGVAGVLGSRFTTSEAALQPILETLKTRGIMFLDNHTTESSVARRLAERLALPHAVNDRMLDEPESNREAVDARLVQVERLALARGFSITMGEPYPVTLDRLSNWAVSLEARGFRLTPISDLATPRPAP
jgi:polysaccharide deacetylase 2 family uncharacterized protein YibQ